MPAPGGAKSINPDAQIHHARDTKLKLYNLRSHPNWCKMKFGQERHIDPPGMLGAGQPCTPWRYSNISVTHTQNLLRCQVRVTRLGATDMSNSEVTNCDGFGKACSAFSTMAKSYLSVRRYVFDIAETDRGLNEHALIAQMYLCKSTSIMRNSPPPPRQSPDAWS